MKKSKLMLAVLALGLVSCGGDNDSKGNKVSTPPSNVEAWEIGPIINGHNYSVGLPKYTAGSFIISSTTEPHYITKPYTTLRGKTSITLHYRIDGEPGTIIYPKCCKESPSIGPTIYFESKDNNWTSDGTRWWATFSAISPMQIGENTITVSLKDNWTSVMTMSAEKNPEEFHAAIDNVKRVGFTLGGGDGFGHGVRATAPVTFTILDYKIE